MIPHGKGRRVALRCMKSYRYRLNFNLYSNTMCLNSVVCGILPLGRRGRGQSSSRGRVERESQCSTLVRNTVVRATFKVNGKPPIWGVVAP